MVISSSIVIPRPRDGEPARFGQLLTALSDRQIRLYVTDTCDGLPSDDRKLWTDSEIPNELLPEIRHFYTTLLRLFDDGRLSESTDRPTLSAYTAADFARDMARLDKIIDRKPKRIH